MLDVSLRPGDLASAIKPGMTPILPEERSTSFAKWCSSRRSRLNDSEDLRRKNARVNSSLGMMTSPHAARSTIDTRRSPAAQASRGPSDSPAMGLSRSLYPASGCSDRWWLNDPDWATDYCLKILSESATSIWLLDASGMRSPGTQTSQGFERAAALLEQTSRGLRRWIGSQVLRYVVLLMDQVEKDSANGLHKPTAPKAAQSAPPSAVGMFGQPAFGQTAPGGAFGAPAPFGASANVAQQQQPAHAVAKTKQEEEQTLKRAKALDRQNQVLSIRLFLGSAIMLMAFARKIGMLQKGEFQSHQCDAKLPSTAIRSRHT